MENVERRIKVISEKGWGGVGIIRLWLSRETSLMLSTVYLLRTHIRPGGFANGIPVPVSDQSLDLAPFRSARSCGSILVDFWGHTNP